MGWIFGFLLNIYNGVVSEMSPTIKQAVGGLGEEVLSTFIDFKNSLNNYNQLDSVCAFFVELDKKMLSFQSKNPEIILGWINKFKTMPDEVKTKTLSLLGGKGNFLGVNFGVNLCNVVNGHNLYDESTTYKGLVTKDIIPKQPVSTIFGAGMPDYIVSDYLTSKTELDTVRNLNLNPTLKGVGKQDEAHGENLVPDKHPERIGPIASEYVQKALKGVYKEAAQFAMWYSSNGSNLYGSGNANTGAPNPNLLANVEGRELSLNVMGKSVNLENISTFNAQTNLGLGSRTIV